MNPASCPRLSGRTHRSSLILRPYKREGLGPRDVFPKDFGFFSLLHFPQIITISRSPPSDLDTHT